MRVEDILRKKGTRIITVRVGETVEVAARLLRSENIGALVVKDVCRTEGNTVVGVFSERDIVRALVDHGAAALRMPVSALMNTSLVSVGPGDSLRRVMDLMNTHQIRHLPVLDGATLIGVISIRDILAQELQIAPVEETVTAPVYAH